MTLRTPSTRMVVKPLRCGLPRRHRQLPPRCLRRLHGPPRLHGLSKMKVRSSLSGAIAGFSSTALRQPSMVSWISPVDRRLRQRFFSALSDDSNPSLAQRLASTLLLATALQELAGMPTRRVTKCQQQLATALQELAGMQLIEHEKIAAIWPLDVDKVSSDRQFHNILLRSVRQRRE